ncbi:MAG: hypothetical protein NVV59_09020 [Chitinophagaceae bacterium]|nr:hypothetical protein [Chitinophagaceae bacterium]
MSKKKIATWVTIIFLATALVAVSLYNRYSRKTFDPKGFINDIREKNKPWLDSLQNAINYENNLNFRIQKAINDSDFKTAYTLMDSLPNFGKKNSIHLYKGMIYVKQNKYSKAIEEYNSLIDAEPFPLALGKRAEVYVKAGKLDLALNDYKEAYSLNYDYSLQVAATFELKNKKR